MTSGYHIKQCTSRLEGIIAASKGKIFKAGVKNGDETTRKPSIYVW